MKEAAQRPVAEGAAGLVPPGSVRSANFALAVFLAAYILSFVDRQILSLMVEPIKRDLGISDLQIGLLQGLAFALLYSVVGVPIGLLADRVSRRRIIACGVIFWSVCTALCGFAGSFAHLFAARMGVGVGEAALSPAAHSSLGDAFPPARLARAMAIYTLGITVGTGVALMVGGSVVDAVTARGDLVLPLLGVRHAWQAAFFAVSLPGIAVAAFVAMTREPKRAVRHADASHGIGALLVYLVANRRAFAAIYGNSTILGIMGYGLVAWYPTLLIRQFGISAGQAANYLGIVYLVIGSAGSLAGGLLAERLARRGHADANLRVVMLISAASIVPATFAPLMPSPLLVMAVFAPLTFLFSGYFGCSIAAIQLATPNGMRATNAAVFLLSNSLIGLSIGAAIIPLVDKWLYGGHGAIGPALSLVGGACCTLGAIAARIGLPAYGAIVSASSAK